jgi:LacI family transcriptional regulator
MTIKKIAKLTGVSIGTVDRVLHRRGRVSKDTETKVNNIIKKYGYKPNIFASNLSLARSYVFSILMPNKHQDSNYWSIPIRGIDHAQRELSIYNINIKYFFFDRHSDISFRKAWQEILNSNIDGLLFAPILTTLSRFYIQNKLSKNVHLSLFDSFIPGVKYVSFIGQDSFQSGVLSGKLMKMLIHKDEGSLVIIRVIPDDYHINERVKGFKSFYKDKSNFKINMYDINNSDDSKEFKEITNRIIQENNDLSGIFVTNASTHYIAKYIKSSSLDKKIHLIGYDLIDNNIRYLKEGVIDFLISQKPEHQGYQGIYTLYRSVVLKEKVNKKIMMPIDIITRENIKYYIE